jgi:hypothetical protein
LLIGLIVPSSDLYQLFLVANCYSMAVASVVNLNRTTMAKIRSCLSGRRSNLPFNFVTTYPGEGKEKIGLNAALKRYEKNAVMLTVSWFRTKANPPAEYGKYSDLLECLRNSDVEMAGSVSAVFRYDKMKVTSIFKRVEFTDEASIFDEVIGFTGVKKGPDGKVLYTLQVSLGERELGHQVAFSRSIKVSEELPFSLLENSSTISSLALKIGKGK